MCVIIAMVSEVCYLVCYLECLLCVHQKHGHVAGLKNGVDAMGLIIVLICLIMF